MLFLTAAKQYKNIFNIGKSHYPYNFKYNGNHLYFFSMHNKCGKVDKNNEIVSNIKNSYQYTCKRDCSLSNREKALGNYEKIFFKFVAKTINYYNVVINSQAFDSGKKFAIQTYIFSIQSFNKHVIENPKLKTAAARFKEKLEEARAELR